MKGRAVRCTECIHRMERHRLPLSHPPQKKVQQLGRGVKKGWLRAQEILVEYFIEKYATAMHRKRSPLPLSPFFFALAHTPPISYRSESTVKSDEGSRQFSRLL